MVGSPGVNWNTQRWLPAPTGTPDRNMRHGAPNPTEYRGSYDSLNSGNRYNA